MSTTRFLLESCQQEVNVCGETSIPYWLVKLKLISDNDIYSRRELEAPTSARKTVKNCVDALSEILEMVSVEDVKLVFDTLVSLYPREQSWFTASRFYCLAILEFENNDDDFRMVVNYHEQAIATWQTHCPHDVELNGYFNIARSHFALGDLFGYSVENQKDLSVYHWKQALYFYELALPICATVATDYTRVSILYQLCYVCKNLLRNDDLIRYGSKAITYQKELMELRLLSNPARSTSREIAAEFETLADIYTDTHQYDDALSNYEKAVSLYLSNENSEVDQCVWCHKLISLSEKIVKICTKHRHDATLILKYQLLKHGCKLKQMGKNVDGADSWGEKARCLAESHFSVADSFIGTQQYVAAYKHLTKGLKYTRLSKKLLLKNGLTLAWRDNRHLLVPLTPDDDRLVDCEHRINEKEEKLAIIQRLLEQSPTQ
jgi:tetratricopeptide (TPR) repeat protein